MTRMMTERTHWETQHNSANGEVARVIAITVMRELTRMQAQVESVHRLRRTACATLGMPERRTDTDVRLELIGRLLCEVTFDMGSWLDAQVVALHDACQTLDARRQAPPPQTGTGMTDLRAAE